MAPTPVKSWLQYGPPTLDRPFGLELWPIFELAFENIVGYKPQDFAFKQGDTPMSTMKVTATMLVTYYIVIFGGREFMRSREPFKLNFLFKVHNLYLTIISGILLLLFAEQLIPELARNGVFHAICHHDGGWTDKLVILYYLNYLTKYVELIDTCFLVLKKKPLTFLHTYHHGATALLCYTQLLGETSVSWVVITLNLMVHVVMYWYYFQSARGIRIWWKQYITVMQIVQFVLDLGFIYYASYTYFTSTYWPWMPNAGTCAGEEFAAFAGIISITSYLVLFISFYLATYKKPASTRKGRGRAKSALIEMKDEKVPTATQVTRRFSGGKSTIPSFSDKPQKPDQEDSNGSVRRNGYATRSRKA